MPANPLANLHRAQVIVSRTRFFATLFAVLTVAWVAVDALALEMGSLARMAALRVAAGAAFAGIAWQCRGVHPSLAGARVRVAALLLVPAAFFVLSQPLLPAALEGPWPRAIAASYAFFPFMIAAGIGAFPLAPLEIAAATLALAAIELVAAPARASMGAFESLWLLLLIGTAAGFAADSQRRLLTTLVERAVRDPLTGCLRRESGGEILALQLALAQRHRTPLAVLFADIDHFKRVNDSFGHETGDRVLAATAEALRDVSRETDTLIRWGGEEFVLVLPHTGARETIAIIERLGRRGLGRQPDGAPVTVSIGVAYLPHDRPRDYNELVRLADERMYIAKQAGRNRYAIGMDGTGPVQIPAPAT